MTVEKIHASQCQGASAERAVALRLNSIRNPEIPLYQSLFQRLRWPDCHYDRVS